MQTFDLIARVYTILNQNQVFWTPGEVVENGLNPAQRLIALRNPAVLVQRRAVALDPHQVLLDLRVEAPRAWRVERIALGDATRETMPPVGEQHGDLRKTTLAALRSHRNWFARSAAWPHAWYAHGTTWIGLYPRQTQPLTVTLIFSAVPRGLRVEEPERESELPREWDQVIAEIAACLLQCKEGAGPEIDQAVARLKGVLGEEPLTRLQKQLLAEQRRQIYGQQMRATA